VDLTCDTVFKHFYQLSINCISKNISHWQKYQMHIVSVFWQTLSDLFCMNVLFFVEDNGGEMVYPASPISCAQLCELRSETSKLRLSGTLQQVDFC